MPSVDDLRNRAELRRQRKENQQSAVEKAQAEAAALSAKSEEQARAKNDETAGTVDATPKPARVATPTDRRKAKEAEKMRSKEKAEAQAERDIRRSPEPVDLNRIEQEALPGSNLTLHQLNAIQEKIDRELRDEGKEIANAAAKGAYETYIGSVAGKRSRHARVRAQIAAGEQAIAARRGAESN